MLPPFPSNVLHANLGPAPARIVLRCCPLFCTGRRAVQARSSASRLCFMLQVELRMVPLTEQYWDRVVAHCIAEIRQGRTPNPDVLCNSR